MSYAFIAFASAALTGFFTLRADDDFRVGAFVLAVLSGFAAIAAAANHL